jgi:hypothetical protein
MQSSDKPCKTADAPPRTRTDHGTKRSFDFNQEISLYRKT